MLYRAMFRTKGVIPLNVFKEDDDIVSCSASRWEGNFYTYIESLSKDAVALKSFTDDELMYEIFHYTPITDKDEWIKDRENPVGRFRFIKLQPEKFASYIFNHYRYQEELRGSRTKHTSIFCFRNQLVMYQEEPIHLYETKTPGELSTNDSDLEKWDVLMHKHFIPGDEWTYGPQVYSYFVGIGE